MSAAARALLERITDLVDQESDAFYFGGETDCWGDLGYGIPDFTGLKLEIHQELARFLEEASYAA